MAIHFRSSGPKDRQLASNPMIHDPSSFVDYWRHVRARTLRVFDVLLPGDLEWTCAPGKFTVGDLFRHLAGIERYMYGETVLGLPSKYPGHSVELADGLEGVRSYLTRAHAEATEIFASLSTTDMASKCTTPGGFPISVWKWLRAMVEHEAHHRGQLYLMAGMLGRQVPPLYGLTEEEVTALSRPGSSPGS